MQKIFSFLLILISTFSFSQDSRIDFKEISKSINDSTSKYFYERLVYKFVFMPSSLDSLEVKHLYYGQLGQEKSNDSIRAISGNFYEKIREKKFSEAIPFGERALKHNPVNLEILGLLVQCYVKADEENRNLPLRGVQFQTLLKTIFDHKIEDGKHKKFTVMAVSDQYVIAGIENINLFQYRRKTEKTKNGMIDYWKQGKKRISFHVIYNY